MRTNLLISAISLIIISSVTLTQVTQEWVKRFTGPGTGYDKANKVIADPSGNIYVTGSTAQSTSNWDYVTIKYNSAGALLWSRTYNGPGNSHDQSYYIALDNSGNVYVTGGSFGNGTERDFCTIKYNPNGDSLWVRRFNGPGNDIDEAKSVRVDASGNVYIMGYSDGGINLDYHTIKYNSAGTELWSARYNFPAPGTGSEDRPHFMAVDAGGNIYVTGESNTGFGFLDMYATVKYNSSGVQQWAARYKGAADSGLSQAYALAVDNSGNVYVTGRSDPASGFGFNFDIATIKYNSSGDSMWVRRYNGPGNSSDIGNAVALDGSGNVIVTGLSVANASSDFFTIKYSPSGDTIWTARYNGPAGGVDAATSLVIDGSNNIYITGFSVGSGTLRDYATLKYGSAGVQQWVQRYNGPGSSEDEALAITLDGSANVYITGMSTGSGTGMDFATIKYSQALGINTISGEIPYRFGLYQNYPNPFNPATKIRFEMPLISINNGLQPLIRINVFDNLGREVTALVNKHLSPGTYEVEWTAGEFPSGIYYYRLTAGNYVETKKMVLMK